MVHQLLIISKVHSLIRSSISIYPLFCLIGIVMMACEENVNQSRTEDEYINDYSGIDQIDEGLPSAGEEYSNLDAEPDIIDQTPSCQWHDDCSETEQCVEQVCTPASDRCLYSQNCPLGEVCYQGRCVKPCLSDLQCPENGHCINGSCIPFPNDFRTQRSPELLGEPEQLWIGVGTAPLSYPIGVSAAGYGGRAGPSTPYNKSLGGSHSVVEKQDIRVLVIDNGETLSILTRLPLSWSTDYLRSLIAKEVSNLTETSDQEGIDILDQLVIFATHSHSQPGRFWNLVPTLPFGTFGFGTFSTSIIKGYAGSIAQAIVEALDQREPSRIGWHVLDNSDPQRNIHSNRRQTNEHFDDRMLTLRVDNLDGEPKAALVGYGIHGTHLMTPLLTGDAAAGIEQVLTERLSAKYGRYIPLIFANGNAGNISPRGDHLTNQSLGHLQTIGELLWNVYEPVFDTLNTQSDIALRMRTNRIELGYEQIGYDLAQNKFEGRDGIYKYGAFQCVQDELSPNDEPYRLENPSCLMDLQRIVHEPIPQFQKTVVSVIQLGDLFITTLPGEPTSGLGLSLAMAVENLAQESGFISPRSFNFGYAQDHQFYLLEPDDWFMGGYEASMSTWGPFLGRYIADSVLLTTEELILEEPKQNTKLKPTWWSNLENDWRPSPDIAPSQASWVRQPIPSIQRGQLVTLEWIGGDPAVDLPTVTLMKAGTDQAVPHPISGLTFDDSGFESILQYLGDYAEDQRWTSRWDLPFELTAGQYWFKVQGLIGNTSERYTLSSSVFEIIGTNAIAVHEYTQQQSEISIKFTYSNAPSNDDGETPFEQLKPTGSYLHLRNLSTDLSEPSGPLKSYRFILGSPINDEITVKIWINDSPNLRPRNPDLLSTILPERSACQIQLVVSRDVNNVDTIDQLSNVPCDQVTYLLPDEHLDEEIWLIISDRYGNESSLVQTNP